MGAAWDPEPENPWLEQIKRQQRDRRRVAIWTALIGVLLVVVVGVISLEWAEYVYGDWTCAFAECRKVQIMPPATPTPPAPIPSGR